VSDSASQIPVVSHVQMTPLLRARRDGAVEAAFSADLGMTSQPVPLTAEGVDLGGALLRWETITEIADVDNACFVLNRAPGAWQPERVFRFSDVTGRHVSLYPTARAPALLVAGLPMHRLKTVDPLEDTRLKTRAAQPAGIVLDTAMGLGYTAMEAAQRAEHVITVEIDPAVVEVARLNPWSQPLFTHPRIERRLADSAEVIAESADESFTRILHDPPTMTLTGELYSGAYYRELFRVLRKGGRLFHYIGDLNSTSGARTVRGVIERLQAAGFRGVQRRPEAFAVIAFR